MPPICEICGKVFVAIFCKKSAIHCPECIRQIEFEREIDKLIQKKYPNIDVTQVAKDIEEHYLGDAMNKAYRERLYSQGKLFEYKKDDESYFIVHSDHAIIISKAITSRTELPHLMREIDEYLKKGDKAQALQDALRLNYDLFIDIYVMRETRFFRFKTIINQKNREDSEIKSEGD